MIMKEHVDSHGASPLANLKARRKSLNQCCGREEANVVRQERECPWDKLGRGILVRLETEEESPASNRVCFNGLGQMNDINVG